MQVTACSRAAFKTANLATPILALQNGPFCTRQLRGVERQQGAQNGGYLRCCGAFGLVDRRVVLLLRVAKRSQVRADPLRAWLPDVEPGADHADRGHPPGRHLTRELLSSPRPQRAIARSARCFRSGRRASREPARADDHHEHS